MIEHHGEAKAKAWLEGLKSNLAHKPAGNDRAQVKGVYSGQCDIAIGNTYYMAKMQLNEKKPEQKKWAASVKILFPNSKGRGTHVNLSGASLAKYSPNRANGIALIEFLTSQDAQKIYAEVNHEYPVKPGVEASKQVRSWGSFKPDPTALEEIAALTSAYWTNALHSFMLACSAGAVAVCLGLIMVFARRLNNSGAMSIVATGSSIGYAVPGTILAIGVFITLSWFDAAIETMGGTSVALVISGTTGAIIFAYVIRFFAIPHGALDAGMAKLSPHLDDAARSLGRSPASMLKSIHLPLLRPAIGAGALLVFVDSMKELPATLLLRPFNFDTLATHVYTLASLDQFEEAAPEALSIVLIGLVPVLVLNRFISSSDSKWSKTI